MLNRTSLSYMFCDIQTDKQITNDESSEKISSDELA